LASQGSVVARVYTSDAYIPLPDIPVSFFITAPDGSSRLLTVVRTNSSGLTPPVAVQTPDLSASLSPSTGVVPYTPIEIRADVPGYGSIRAEGVQIFPGVETVQGLRFFPKAGNMPDSTVLIKEPPQNL